MDSTQQAAQRYVQGMITGNLAVARAPMPDFIIKYEPVNTPTPVGGEEEMVCGNEMDAISRVRDLIETGRTTPGRVWIYANLNPVVEVSVSFPPRPSR